MISIKIQAVSQDNAAGYEQTIVMNEGATQVAKLMALYMSEAEEGKTPADCVARLLVDHVSALCDVIAGIAKTCDTEHGGDLGPFKQFIAQQIIGEDTIH